MRTAIGMLATTSALGLLLFSVPVMAQTRPVPDIKTWITEHDKNGDGRIDRGEFHEAVVEAFYFRDKNKRGYLTMEELTEAPPEAVKAANRKKDGKLTLDEYVNALFKDFEAADTDHDGMLTVEEIVIYMRSAK